MQFDSCTNMVDTWALEYTKIVQYLMRWAALSSSPLLMHMKGGALGRAESLMLSNLENGNNMHS